MILFIFLKKLASSSVRKGGDWSFREIDINKRATTVGKTVE